MNRLSGHTVPGKKRVLLVTHGEPRSALQSALRDRAVEVVAVRGVENARDCLNRTVFNLVVFDCQGDAKAVGKLCGEIGASRKATQVTFLVGKPDYLAASPRAKGLNLCPEAILAKLDPFRLAVEASGGVARKPRFIEAIWRMHLLRATCRPAAVPPPDRAIEVAVKRELPRALEFGEAVRQAEGTPEFANEPA